jgi:hypothetical protein
MIAISSHTNGKLIKIDNSGREEFDFENVRGIDILYNNIAISYDSTLSIYDINNFDLIDQFYTSKNVHEISLQNDNSIIFCDQTVFGLNIYSKDYKKIYFSLFKNHIMQQESAWISGLALNDVRMPTHITALGIDENIDQSWRNAAFNAQGALVDVNTGEILLNNLFFPHSPRWINGELMFLNSGDGTIRRYVDGNSEIIGHEAGWLRGFAQIDSNTILVGTSARRHTALDNLQITDADATGVMVIDLPSMKQIDFIPWDVDEIFDIKYVP